MRRRAIKHQPTSTRSAVDALNVHDREDRAQRIIDTARDAFISIDERGRVEDWNDAAEITFGWRADEAVGQPLHDLIIPLAQRPAHSEGLARMMRGGPPSILGKTLELTALRRDGTEFPVELTVWAAYEDRRSYSAFVRDISAREAATTTSARLAAVVQSSTDAILSVDPEGIILTWNSGAEAIYGYSAEEAIGRPAGALLAPAGTMAGRELARESLGRGEAIQRELTLVRADGRHITVSDSSSPILDAEGRLIAISSISRDISAAKDAERALADSEARYRLLVDLSTDVITRVSPTTGLVTYVSPAVTPMLGWTPDQLIGGPFSAIAHPDAGPSQLHAIVGRDGFHTRILQLRCSDNSWRWCEALSRSIVDPITGALDIQSSIRDIADRVAAQEALAHSEERLRVTQLHAPTGQALVALDGRYLQVNPAMCAFLGRTEEDILSLTVQDVTHPDDAEEDSGLIAQLLRDDIRGYEMEKRYVRPSGAVVWALLSRSLVRVGDEPKHFITQVLDITARKHNEEALALAQVQVGALNRELSVLSRTDALTGAFNRRHLDETLTTACRTATRFADPVALLLVDIDYFKKVNDEHGHRRGDDALKSVVERLRTGLRTGDTLGRWGGEEFLIISPRTDQDAAVRLADRLRLAVCNEPIPAGEGGDELRVSVSVGVAASTSPSPDALIAAADRALYRAKASGRNRVAAE